MPSDRISWNVTDVLNVVVLPGDQPYQINDEDMNVSRGGFSLGIGRGSQEEIQCLNDETGLVNERV